MMLQPLTAGIPIPAPTPRSQPYWDGVQRGELRYQRCDRCGTAAFGPTSSCARCFAPSTALTWHVGAGRGSLYSWTIVWRPPLPAFTAPYAPCIVRLDEGFDMVSALVGIDHEALTLDMADAPVQVVFHSGLGEDDTGSSAPITLPFFTPVADRPTVER